MLYVTKKSPIPQWSSSVLDCIGYSFPITIMYLIGTKQRPSLIKGSLFLELNIKSNITFTIDVTVAYLIIYIKLEFPRCVLLDWLNHRIMI